MSGFVNKFSVISGPANLFICDECEVR